MTTQAERYGLTTRDLEDISHDLRYLSIFVPEPLEVSVPGLPTIHVGVGLGGFSWSLFTRAGDCNACGNCCKNTHRRVWFWYDGETMPERHREFPLDLTINGKNKRIFLHINQQGDRRCDYLKDAKWEDRDVAVCSIHDDGTKPLHCMYGPFLTVYPVGKSKTPMLSRRLPPRNWRWPDCPIDVYSNPMTDKQISEDSRTMQVWSTVLEDLPTSIHRSMFPIWESGLRDPKSRPTSSLEFKKIFVGTQIPLSP